MKEKKHRFEDALSATRAAVEEGVVPGGGVTLLRCVDKIKTLSDDDVSINWGINVVRNALTEPLKRVAENAGYEGSVVVEKVQEQKGSNGFNALTGKYCDLLKVGVIDPLVVTRSALRNAASIASMVLTTEVMISDLPEEKEHPMGGPPPGGGMPGMGGF